MRIKVRIKHDAPAAPAGESLPPSVPQAPRSPGPAGSGDRGLFLIFLLFVLFLLLTAAVLFYGKNLLKPPHFYVRSVMSFSGQDQACGAFNPWDLTLTPNGFALTDQPGKRVLFFDHQGKYLSQITQKDAGPPNFRDLCGITIDPQGNLYVLDNWNGLIRPFTPKGKALRPIDLNNKGFYGPANLYWDNGSFLIADTGSHRVVRVTPDGVLTEKWGQRGGSRGQLQNPRGLAWDREGNFYVADSDNFRLQSLLPGWYYRWGFKMDAKVIGVALDERRGLVYVSGGSKGNVEVLTLTGGDLGTLTLAGAPDRPIPNLNVFRVTEDGYLVAGQGRSIQLFEPVTMTGK